ncbi:helix-turn-helix transcriptional regulator [Pseudonocardia sp. TRM90224]|uniref:helix-turn-helix transcriptional regulator n=1 Tax=Pseudonocardia sp. TRM90224 TaxID=2812678 RepID=UPI0035A91A11
MFGTQLRAARLTLGLSQHELAERAGVSPRAIRYIEAGKVARPHARTMERRPPTRSPPSASACPWPRTRRSPAGLDACPYGNMIVAWHGLRRRRMRSTRSLSRSVGRSWCCCGRVSGR